jgi:hypothetical protein
MNTLELKETKICIECELLFNETQQCPRCGSLSWQWLAKWLVPLRNRKEMYGS